MTLKCALEIVSKREKKKWDYWKIQCNALKPIYVYREMTYKQNQRRWFWFSIEARELNHREWNENVSIDYENWRRECPTRTNSKKKGEQNLFAKWRKIPRIEFREMNANRLRRNFITTCKSKEEREREIKLFHLW